MNYPSTGLVLNLPLSISGKATKGVRALYFAAVLVITAGRISAQDALRYSLTGDAAAESIHRQAQNQPYTIKSGDFRMLLTPALEFDYNDNINNAHTGALDDFIIFPKLGVTMSYPITQHNLLLFDVTFGYQDYLQHGQYSTWFVQSGSALSFDIFVKDFKINLHDRFSYVQNSSQQAAVANTGLYGTSQNTAGLDVTWDLQDVTLNLGYDHLNYSSTSQSYSYTDHTSEMLVGRAGFKFHPSLTAGLEATSSFTTYDQKVLNDNIGTSVGPYADWMPGHYLHVKPRIGYTYYFFDQTSRVIPAVNQDAWYFDLTVTHNISEAVTYSFSAGHELTLGLYGDTIEDWYFRPMVSLNIIKNLALHTSFSYQNGTQGLGNSAARGVAEDYGWLTWSLGLNYPLMKKLTVGLDYRLTLRSSNYAAREYTQNFAGLVVSYLPQ